MQIIFHKRATKYRSLLQKMACKNNGSYESSPPCTRKREPQNKGEMMKWAESESASKRARGRVRESQRVSERETDIHDRDPEQASETATLLA